MKPRALLEVCVDSPAGLAAAIAGGADRIELCAALALGGLTPAPGLIALARQAPVPVHAMIRPRAGDFVYTATELVAMQQDIAAVRAAGLAGVVLGATHADGTPDAVCLAALAAAGQGLDRTLHRAIDLAPQPLVALALAIELGFARVLTSGGAATALEGASAIAALVAAAGGRIAVMAGSGVRPENAALILRRTGVCEIHASCAVASPADPRLVGFGFAAADHRETDAALVAALRAALADA